MARKNVMSTRISRLLFLASSALLLNACTTTQTGKEAGQTANRGFALAEILTQGAPREITVARNTVTVAGPDGYCVDKRTTRQEDDAAFVLLMPCKALSPVGQNDPDLATVLYTATVAPGAAPSMEELSGFFKTDSGLSALSRNGKASDVTLVSTKRESEMFLLHLRDKGHPEELSPDIWRAIFNVNDHIVAASLVSSSGNQPSTENGFSAIRSFAERIQRSSPRPAQPSGVQTTRAGPLTSN